MEKRKDSNDKKFKILELQKLRVQRSVKRTLTREILPVFFCIKTRPFP
jgi:hypothetical protein